MDASDVDLLGESLTWSTPSPASAAGGSTPRQPHHDDEVNDLPPSRSPPPPPPLRSSESIDEPGSSASHFRVVAKVEKDLAKKQQVFCFGFLKRRGGRPRPLRSSHRSKDVTTTASPSADLPQQQPQGESTGAGSDVDSSAPLNPPPSSPSAISGQSRSPSTSAPPPAAATAAAGGRISEDIRFEPTFIPTVDGRDPAVRQEQDREEKKNDVFVWAVLYENERG